MSALTTVLSCPKWRETAVSGSPPARTQDAQVFRISVVCFGTVTSPFEWS